MALAGIARPQVWRGQSPGPSGSQGEDPEGGLWPDPRTQRTLVFPVQDDLVQHFLTSGSQRDCLPSKRDGARYWERRESQILPGDKVMS